MSPIGSMRALTISLLFVTAAKASTGAGVTYHGRLVGPDGTPVASSTVQFRLQIRTPGSENCLMYEEIQNKDMSASNGVFSVTINDGTGTRQDTNAFPLDQIFGNRGSFSFPVGYCIVGAGYSPNTTDGRKLQVYFNDGSFSGWEPVPAQDINFVPMAIEALQVGGYHREQLVKVANGVDTSGFDLSASAFAELIALVGGTSTQFVKPGAASFTAAPQWSGVPAAGSDLVNKTYVDAQVAAGLPNVGTPGTYAKVTTDAKGRVTVGTSLGAADIPALDAAKITTGILGIANGGTGASSLTGNALIASNSGGTALVASGISDNGTVITATRSIASITNPIAAGAVVNLASSNSHTLAAVGGSAIAISNQTDGGVYNIVVEDVTSRTYTFTGCTNSYFKPVNGPTTVSTRTIYGLMTVKKGANWDCYITWSTGFQ